MQCGQTRGNSNILISEAMQALGYGTTTGMCAGLTMMGIRAFFNKSIQNFNARILSIIQHVNEANANYYSIKSKEISASAHNNQPLSASDQDYYEDMALLDGTALLQNPLAYTSYFNQSIGQGEYEKVMPFTFADNIEKHGGIQKRGAWLSRLNSENIKKYLQSINHLATPNNTNIALVLNSLTHTIGFCYDATSTSWILVNPNNLPVKYFSQNEFDNLVGEISAIYFNANETILETKIYTLGHPPLTLECNFYQITSENIIEHVQKNKLVIFHAAKEGYTDLIKSLADHGVSFNVFLKKQGISPVYLAAQNGHRAALEIMAKAGADLNIQSPGEGNTPATIATYYDQTGVIDVLGQYHADLNLATKMGVTPALIAARRGNVDILKILVNYGIDLNRTAPCGFTALEIATAVGKLQAKNFIMDIREKKLDNKKLAYSSNRFSGMHATNAPRVNEKLPVYSNSVRTRLNS